MSVSLLERTAVENYSAQSTARGKDGSELLSFFTEQEEKLADQRDSLTTNVVERPKHIWGLPMTM